MQETTDANDLFSGLDSFLSTDGTISVDTNTDKEVVKDGESSTENPKKDDKEKNYIEIPEETKEEDKAEEVEIVDENNQDDNSQATALKEFAKVLVENEVFQTLNIEEYDGSIEGLKDAIYNQAKEIADERDASLPAVIKELIDNYEEGVPLEELIKIKSSEIKYSSLDTEKIKEDESLQKQIYKDYLKKTTSFNDTRIEKEINRLVDLGELDKEVEEALPELVTLEKKKEKQLKEEVKQKQELQKKQQEETLKSIKTTTESFKNKEIVPGIKLTDKDVSSIYKSLTTPVGYDENGAPMSALHKLRSEDPIGFEVRLNYLATLTKGFTDFTPVIKKAGTVATKKLENTINSQPFKTGKSTIVEESTSNDILSAANKFLDRFKK